MGRTITTGPWRQAARSWATLMAVSAATLAGRARRGPLVEGWSLDFEIGARFWRAQFERALAMRDFGQGRLYFDSPQTWTDEVYEVERRAAPGGCWIVPRGPLREATLFYLHGGGYAFHAGISRRFAEMLAAHLRARLYALDYRLTPEHPHPAQQEDALAGYRHLLAEGVAPERLVVIGDSAGGHLALMTPFALREAGLPAPALIVGLCPWTDIGARGESFFGNDRFDLVQGHMALRFGEWLAAGATREALSPAYRDLSGLPPIYLQGGGREILIDGVRDFAAALARAGCEATLDVWPDMVHDFQAHGRTRGESGEALDRIDAAICAYAEGGPAFGACARTERASRAAAI